jgi:diadenosine tetraphosphate (Ap4A) HIT family hydrolase
METEPLRKDPSCPFCTIAPEKIWLRNDGAIAFPDAFPAAEGHTLVVPRRHVLSVFDLPETERDAVWRLVAAARERLRAEWQPDGFTIGINDGPAAGQTVPHGHIHLIPRRRGERRARGVEVVH